MKDCRKFYINNQWVAPLISNDWAVENPATEETIATISIGSGEDAGIAISAARSAFWSYSQTSVDERIALLEKLLAIYTDRYDEMAAVISLEMGAPASFASDEQAYCGQGHLMSAIDTLKLFQFESQIDNARILREPIGVCGLITPWNWPINQITCKVAPALAVGCTMILKPSELAPLSAYLFSEFVDQAGFPAGVYNMLNGDGVGVGTELSSNLDVDMVSFTGSTRAGILVAKSAANSVKRVTQELGGKSPDIIFADANLAESVSSGVAALMQNSGQSCDAPSRMLIESSCYDQCVTLAYEAASAIEVNDPLLEGEHIGPLSSHVQFDKVQAYIQKGIDEGARLLIGGLGRPSGFDKGYFVKPTVFADVSNDMAIASEEIFGPVLCLIPFQTEQQAILIANQTPYGLAAYVNTADDQKAIRVAGRLKAGMVRINGAEQSFNVPFGGYKSSGNGREWGAHGFEDFLETKAISI